MTLRSLWLTLPFVALMSVGCGALRDATAADKKPPGFAERRRGFSTESIAGGQPPLSSEPSNPNPLAALAGNKFDSWTITHRVDMPLNR